MSRYEELVKAFGRGEHESYVSLERHEEFARKLLSGIQSNFEIPRDQLHLYPLTPNAPLEEEGSLPGPLVSLTGAPEGLLRAVQQRR